MWAYDPNEESTWEAEDHMRIWEAMQAAQADTSDGNTSIPDDTETTR